MRALHSLTNIYKFTDQHSRPSRPRPPPKKKSAKTARQDKFGFFLRKRTTLAMEGFLCTVAVCIVITLSQRLSPYSRGAGTSDAGPGGGACFMMMEWEFLLPFCVLQVCGCV